MYFNTERLTPNNHIYTLLFSVWLLIPSFVIVYAYQTSLHEAETAFEQSCGRFKDLLFERLHSNEAVIAGFVSFLEASQEIDYQRASIYAKRILKHFSHINTIEFVEAVAHDDLPRFTAQQRQQNLEDFTIRTFNYSSDRQWRPVEKKPYYFPLTFMEPPLSEAHEVLGLDLDSIPFFQEAMLRASQINNTVATQPFELVQGGRAFGLLQPVPGAQIPETGMAYKYATLIITQDSLLKDLDLSVDNGLALGLYLAEATTPSAKHTALFEFEGDTVSTLAQRLLPALTLEDVYKHNGQAYYFKAHKQLTWSDIDLSLLIKLLMAATLTFLLLLSYLRAIKRIEKERVALTRQLEYKAFHDGLTGLANRTLITDRLNHAINNASRTHQDLAVMFLDLDRFKAVNDSFGHETGDGLLQKFAQRLRENVRKNDTVGRLGGDEFIIVLEHIRDQADAEILANKLHGALCEPYFHHDIELHIGVSIGIAYFPDDGSTCSELLKKADEGMYCNKQYQCHRPDPTSSSFE